MTVDLAWNEYNSACEAMRQRMLADPMCAKYPAFRASAHYVLQQTQAIVYNTVLAPIFESPVFTRHHFIMPIYYTAHQPNPDFCYDTAFLDSRRDWRIRGRRNTAHWVDIQSSRGWWGDRELGGIANYDLDDFAMDADGSFEIVASATPQRGNWIQLDTSCPRNTISVRPAMYDWENETPPYFEIEALDDAALDDAPIQPVTLNDNEIIERLERAGEMVRHSIGRWTTRASPRLATNPGMNRFVAYRGDPSRGGANPLARYGQAAYELGPDDALILETDWPDARYWGLSLGTWWWETVDPVFHHSSINGHQAVRDSDGKLRVVVAHRDPGVANWLDPVGWNAGVILFRWYRPQRDDDVITRVVRLSELDQHLPADVARVTPIERKQTIDARRNGVLRWYGWRS